jgi:hypothetical protein
VMHLAVVIARSLSVDGDLPPIDALTHDDHAIWPKSRKFLAPTRMARHLLRTPADDRW